MDLAELLARATSASQAGDLDSAIAAYEGALRAAPGHPAVLVNLGALHRQAGHAEAALACLEEATRLQPTLAAAWYNLGTLHLEAHRADDAAGALRRTIACIEAGDASAPLAAAATNAGLALQTLGRHAEARALLEGLAARHPGIARECLRVALFSANLDPDTPPQVALDAHRDWARRFADPLGANAPELDNDPDPARRLRIGYLSGDFWSHAVARFIGPVMAAHAPRQVEVWCVDNSPRSDAATGRLRQHAKWLPIAGLDDEQAARQIRAAGIDVLVDLSGHTAHNRLELVARRVAPVQAGWLGYSNTTGLEAMDARITDALVDPPGAERWYVERLLRLPDALWCFSGDPDAPDPGPLPMLRNGHVTFGSMNQYGKLNDAVYDAWAGLLSRVPESRLLLAVIPGGGVPDMLRAAFASRGIDPSRLRIEPYLPRKAFLALYRQVDIALDPFPCCGGASTCDSLWMGTPVVTLAGGAKGLACGVSRAGASLMSVVGLPELVARSAPEYVEVAVALAEDAPRLAGLRAGMRERLLASPLMDATGFTRSLEGLLRAEWTRWCETRRSRA